MGPWRRALGQRTVRGAGLSLAIGGTGFAIAEAALPVGLPRLAITVGLAFGFPVSVFAAWVSVGSLRRRALLGAALASALAASVWIANREDRGGELSGPYFIAHLGVHQRMHPEHTRSSVV
jgi:hypothetical protein